MRITTDYLHWNSETSTFSAEISDFPESIRKTLDPASRRPIVLVNPGSGKEVSFEFSHPDTDGEDIFGWNFTATVDSRIVGQKRKLNLLIIND